MGKDFEDLGKDFQNLGEEIKILGKIFTPGIVRIASQKKGKKIIFRNLKFDAKTKFLFTSI